MSIVNIAAYCRVSTDKEDQLNSLDAQKQFFTEYAQRANVNLVRSSLKTFPDSPGTQSICFKASESSKPLG